MPKKKHYNVHVNPMTVFMYVSVTAENEDEAIEKAQKILDDIDSLDVDIVDHAYARFHDMEIEAVEESGDAE